MTSFNTPDPITAVIEVPLGTVHVIASERTDTTVVINPSDPSRRRDVETVERIRTDLAGRTLTVKVPRTGPKPGSIDVTIEIPERSRLDFKGGVADLRADGKLSDTRVKSGVGDAYLDETARLDLVVSTGRASVNRVGGDGTITVGGDVQVSIVDGKADIKNLNGKTWIGEVGAGLRVRSANGDIEVGRVGSDVAARTANGHVTIGELVSGSTSVATAAGNIDIGIADGTSAWLDVRTSFGRVFNEMASAQNAAPNTNTVEIRARTPFGDINVHRSTLKGDQ